MPQVRKVSGNHPYVVRSVFTSEYFPDSRAPNGRLRNVAEETLKRSSYVENVTNIFKDLPRNAFLPSGGKTADDYVRDWSNTPSYDFAQGNLTAGLYHSIMVIFMLHPDFLKEDTGRNPDEFQEYLTSVQKVDFAYYNDEGIPCGISISYSLKDPSLWFATIIRNTTGMPENRETLCFSSSEFIRNDDQDKQKELVESNTVAQEFLAFAKSKTVADLFEGTILANGNVDTAKLELLDSALKDMDLINIGRNEVFKDRKRHFEQQVELHEQALKAIKKPALELVAKQSFVRRNAGSLFLGFLVLATLVNLVLIATGVLAPLGFLLEGVKNYLVFGGAAVVGVASAANLANNEHQLSTYKADVQKLEQSFEPKNRKDFRELDLEEAEAEKRLREQEQQVVVPSRTNQIDLDDSQEFGEVGQLVDEVVRDDSQLSRATVLVESISLQPPVDTSSQTGVGVIVPKKKMRL
ncbi:hypothetical protein [Legionella tunisiensis]|uniref:hypothetical protein n=1 Tax=Legionella tunisiensis TaxID=1034944 RepID=UPI0002E7AEC1|nr:hypothetical protein [Legionella tunisiensis]